MHQIEVFEGPEGPRRTGIFGWTEAGFAVIDTRRPRPPEDNYRPAFALTEADREAKRAAEDYVAKHLKT